MKKNKIFLLIISLMAASILWIYVVTVVNPEGNRTITGIPVVLSGEDVLREDQSLIITGGRTATVTAEFHGKNADLNKLLQQQDEITAVVDVTRIRTAKSYTMSYDLNLPNSVQDAGITVTSRSPSSITFEVQKQVSMPIEIRGDFTGVSVAEGYMLEKTSFDYDVVQVTGTESVVSTIDCAQVIITRTNLDKTVTDTVPFTLCDKDGNAVDTANLSMDISTVDVTLNVVKYKDVALEVEILDGGGATSKDAKVTIDPESITLSGDSTVLDAINKITLGTIDLADMESNTLTQSFDIIIPNDTKNVSGVDQANVTVTIRNKETAVIRATNIAFIHEPEGLTATSMTKQVQVLIRASTADISKITSNNLRVVADLSDYTTAGTNTVPVTIYIDGFPDAGVIGDEYTIVVTLAEKTDEKNSDTNGN